MLDRGYKIRFRSCNATGRNETVTEARLPSGEWIPLMDFLKDHVSESLHELIRGNVVMATRYFHHRVKTFIRTIVMGDNNPMNVEYYTYKIEFQERGAEHVHGTVWLSLKMLEKLIIKDGILQNPSYPGEKGETPLKGLSKVFQKLKNNETLSNQDTTCLRHFIDAFICVSTDEWKVGVDVSKIVKEVNQHHHTKTCRKRGSKCRFNYPKPPAPYTIIAQPVPEKDLGKRSQIVQAAAKTIQKVMDLLEKDSVITQIDKDLKSTSIAERIREVCRRADVKYKDYVTALGISNRGYTVVFERDITETFINPFNKHWIKDWNANMDLQPVLDFFAVVTYVTDYYSKDDSGTMEVLKAALKDQEGKDVKERMKDHANVYLTHRQIGEAEAVYR